MNLSQFSKDNKFLMLALDHRGSFKELINKDNPDQVSDEEIITVKSDIISALSDQFSGVLLDPQWGLKAYPEKQKPYLLSIEKTGYLEREMGARVTELEYTVSQLKEMGAQGIKLLIYYDHDSVTSLNQMETSHKVLEDCKKAGLPLFLEIVTYNNRGLKHQQILSGISLFLDQGIRPDVFKLEYPGAEEYCQKITSILGDTPWILLTRGENFTEFTEQLTIATRYGAKGFLAGRSLWQEACAMKDNERKEFLNSTVKKRFEDICRIAG